MQTFLTLLCVILLSTSFTKLSSYRYIYVQKTKLKRWSIMTLNNRVYCKCSIVINFFATWEPVFRFRFFTLHFLWVCTKITFFKLVTVSSIFYTTLEMQSSLNNVTWQLYMFTHYYPWSTKHKRLVGHWDNIMVIVISNNKKGSYLRVKFATHYIMLSLVYIWRCYCEVCKVILEWFHLFSFIQRLTLLQPTIITIWTHVLPFCLDVDVSFLFYAAGIFCRLQVERSN